MDPELEFRSLGFPDQVGDVGAVADGKLQLVVHLLDEGVLEDEIFSPVNSGLPLNGVRQMVGAHPLGRQREVSDSLGLLGNVIRHIVLVVV